MTEKGILYSQTSQNLYDQMNLFIVSFFWEKKNKKKKITEMVSGPWVHLLMAIITATYMYYNMACIDRIALQVAHDYYEKSRIMFYSQCYPVYWVVFSHYK